MEVYINAVAELAFLQSIPAEEGGIVKGEEFFFAYDLRPSSSTCVPEQFGRGEIAQAIERAISDAGMMPVNCGCIPTPALAFHAISRGKGSVMITGSHIPFDRNGYKTNTSCGELLKRHEQPIGDFVQVTRERIYNQPFDESPFNEQGMFKTGHADLSSEDSSARSGYMQRYLDFFEDRSLDGMRLLCYQHSAVGRDLLVDLLCRFGAEVIPVGRSEEFVPIDTENIDADRLSAIQALATTAISGSSKVDAVVSTDGDSDRPMVLGVDPDMRAVRFFSGDLLGMIVAEYLGADAVVVPLNCNDGIDASRLSAILEPKTRIGSPYVIAGMAQALERGKQRVCGWEANGGFLTGSDFIRSGRILAALPTRDAVLPILCALFSSRDEGVSLCELFSRLPKRFSYAGLIKQFPRAVSLEMIRQFSFTNCGIQEVVFNQNGLDVRGLGRASMEVTIELESRIQETRERLETFFRLADGFGAIVGLNYTDGVRISFSNGDVAHLRTSGNADELRLYAVSDSQIRAEKIVKLGIAEPDGILRSIEKGEGDQAALKIHGGAEVPTRQ
jgi:phosphomannomutase